MFIFIAATIIIIGLVVSAKKELNLTEAGQQGVFEIALRQANAQDVPLALILAIIEVESSFDPNAKRDEPQINDASWGLMQVLFRTAAWLGYQGPPEGLLDPETSIFYGTRYLVYQLDRYGWDIEKTIAAYNAGTAKYTADGSFINQTYVNKVLRALARWQK